LFGEKINEDCGERTYKLFGIDCGGFAGSGVDGVGELYGGTMMSIGMIGVSSVITNSWDFGHLRDQAGWFPSQKGI
jgi:hypothetical protein